MEHKTNLAQAGLRAIAVAGCTLLVASCSGGGGSGEPDASSAAVATSGQIVTGSSQTAGAIGITNNGPSVITVANTNAGTLAAAPAGADGWTQCAAENELCIVPGPMQVRFGVPGHYAYRIISEAVNCTFAEFCDPAYGSFKTCSYAPLSNGRADQPVFAHYSSGNILGVGPGRTYATPCAALTVAKDGDVIEIEASGTYIGDTCAFGASDLIIRGVNGRPKISAGGKWSWGKGIWIPYGYYTTIENVELTGAAVPDQNGAAIRQDGKHLVVRNSYIHHNENGILTSNDGDSTLVVENTEFAHNGHGDGRSHNVYAGHLASLVFRGNYSHDANIGHNLKSRAQVNNVFYNRFSSTDGGRPSYELNFPNAGTTYVVGNIIEQPAENDNTNILAYGEEGPGNHGNSLYVINNTFINDAGSGQFLMIDRGVRNKALVQNNVFTGSGNITGAETIGKNNYRAGSGEFVDYTRYDLRPAEASDFIGKGSDPGVSDTGVRLTPLFEYQHVAGRRVRGSAGASDLGAYAR